MPEESEVTQIAEERHRSGVTILVNDEPVQLAERHVSGLEIKQAAIAAGLPIEIGFQLIEELPHDRTRVVGDTDVVEVRDDSRFLALAPDDNS